MQTVTFDAYVYTWEWYIREDGTMDPDASIYFSKQKPNDGDAVIIDVIPTTVKLPKPEALRGRKLASLEQQLNQVRRHAMEEMRRLEEKIESMRALEHTTDG